MKEDKQIVVALTGASGAVVGVEILRILKSMEQVVIIFPLALTIA